MDFDKIKNTRTVFLWRVFYMKNHEDEDTLFFILGRFTNRIKRAFYRMSSNSKWTPIPNSLIPRNTPVAELTNFEKFGWLGYTPLAIMAKIRSAQK